MELPGFDHVDPIEASRCLSLFRARRVRDARPVLLGRGPAAHPPDLAALERELAALHGLRLDGVPRALELAHGSEGVCLLLEDPGGAPLAEIIGRRRVDLDFTLRVALGACEILAGLHRLDLVHGHLSPSSIFADPTGAGVHIVSLVRSLAPDDRSRASWAPLTYASPEHTGRIDRPADLRSDLYSLGIVLYELLTGAPPFVSRDPLELVHAHIARTPAPPSTTTPGVPDQVARIVLKLLAKSPDDRYQTAAGVGHDLARCREQWVARGQIDAWPLGLEDVSDRLVIPQRLYGRDREVADLLAAFEAAAAGRASLLLVSGYSGIGKTSLINELYRPIVQRRGTFVAGKFDQVVRNIPFGAFAQALRALMWQLLADREDQLAALRVRLLDALSANGGVLARIVPEIALIIGPQPAPPPLDPAEERNRFLYVVQRFVGVLARADHPLVVFLDDLQWADPATLDLIHALLTDEDIRYLFIIGAYRDNEVGADHLLTWAIARAESAQVPIGRVSLSPLSEPDLLRFLRDTLRDAEERLVPLARLIQRKTDGNPFFVIQFIQTLAQEGLLSFDHERRRWISRMDAIAAAGMTDNVVDLMSRRIRRLAEPAQRVLSVAACVGGRFDVATLVTVGRQPGETVVGALGEAESVGLIQRVVDTRAAGADRQVDAYAFVHDRVQQAAYDLIPDEHKPPLHLDIGRLMLRSCGGDVPDGQVFEIVNHLNIGSPLVSSADERLTVTRLNLVSGRKAKRSTAYRAAAAYCDRGIALIGEAGWASHYGLLFSLHLEAAECRYLLGAFDEADAHVAQLIGRAENDLDRARVHALRIVLYENQSRYGDALESGRDGLAVFGMSLPLGDQAVQALEGELAGVERALGGRAIASLVDLPEVADERVRMIMRLLTAVWAPAYISGLHLLARFISASMVRLSLERGNTEDSAYGYVTHAITVGPVLRDFAAAFEWGELALAVHDRFKDVRRRAKIHQQFQAHVNFWRRPWETSIPHAREARRSGLETGDFTYAGYGAVTEVWAAWPVAHSLPRFVREYWPTLGLLEKIRMTDFHAGLRVILNWALALQGLTADPLSLSDASFDEDAFVRHYAREAPFFLTFAHAARLHLHVLIGDPLAAVEAADAAREVAVTGTMWPVLVTFWGAVAAALAADRAEPSARDGYRARVEAAHQELADLARHCPENFRCWALLLDAERHRLDGRAVDGARLADEALAAARETGNLQHEALAHEVCGRMWLAADRTALAAQSLDAARRCYDRWGAATKVDALEARYADLLPARAPATDWLPAPLAGAGRDLDMATVLKAARAIAAEVELDGLLHTLMTLALENAGAERGVFIGERGDRLVIEAEAGAESGHTAVGLSIPIDEAAPLAAGIVRYVHRTRRGVVLGDASADARFGADPHVARTSLKSVLCVPVDYQGRHSGLLYLENNLTSHAFTPERLEVMQILVAQTAISIENARLYDAMKHEIAERATAQRALGEALSELETLKNRLEAENVYLQEEIKAQHPFHEIVGNSPALLEALRKVERVAPTESTVLIVGETGCGKELFARAIHGRSRRGHRPLVKVNCGAIPPGLVESELFGHVRGAFTGAIDKRVGRFELANGGTIFLDEVGELPLEAQVKLLRVLQEQEFEPVGGSRTIKVSVRVIAATNRNLDAAVREGTFRADLLYRLNVLPVEVPPLRERKGDVELLIGFFTARLARKLGKPVQAFSARSMAELLSYKWPGNVRELQNVIERTAILSNGPVLDLKDLKEAFPTLGQTADGAGATGAPAQTLDDVQRSHISRVLASTGGVVEGPRGAARILGLHPNTLRSRMKKLGAV
jgi:predicted ATPase/transcriptional regulator with GAF, ATPase, and Fis domain